jgi:hypothetical protein
MAILAGADSPHDTQLPSPLITIDNVVKHYDPDSVFERASLATRETLWWQFTER